MIDRIELILLDEPLQMRKLHRDNAALLQQQLHPLHEVIDVRNMGQHIVTEQQVGLTVFSSDRERCLLAEESHGRRDAFLYRRPCDVGRGLDTQARYACALEMLQADSRRCWRSPSPWIAATKPEAFDHQVRVTFAHVLPSCPRTKRNTHSQKKCLRVRHTFRAAPGNIARTPTRAVDRTAPCD